MARAGVCEGVENGDGGCDDSCVPDEVNLLKFLGKCHLLFDLDAEE
jgi:hypothetical protein